jgi:catechol 2,3-dioxygenase-like lactoylglutathione lyase family enzyme
MAVHHIALASRNTEATHRFYTEAMGFRLAKVVAGETEKGWSKHFFYDTGDGGFIAFWELHDPRVTDFRADVSTGVGLPIWVNHFAFAASSLEDLAAAKQRWLDHGITVMEADHEWCRSIYTTDPNGILVEWCAMTRDLTAQDEREALDLLLDPNPPLEPPIVTTVTRPSDTVSALAAR